MRQQSVPPTLQRYKVIAHNKLRWDKLLRLASTNNQFVFSKLHRFTKKKTF